MASSDRRIIWLGSASGKLGLLGAGAALALLAACGEKEVILQGERFPVGVPLDASQPTEAEPAPKAPAADPGSVSVPISLPAMQSNADWGQRGGNARHAAPHAALSAAPQLAWAAPIGAGDSRRNRIAAAPVVSGGRVFAMDAGSTVSAVSTGGALLWQADLAASFDRGGGASGGGLAAEAGVLYVTTVYGEVVALSAESGAVIWRQRVDSPATGAPALADGMVYVSGRDGSAWAIDAKDGKVAWMVAGTPGTQGYVGAAAPTVASRSVIFPDATGDLTAVLKIGGGTKVWQESLAGKRPGRAYAQTADITGDAVLVGETLYAGTAAGRTVAMDSGNGEKLWSAGHGAMGAPVVAGGSVFLVNDQAQIVRLDAASGAVLWTADMPYFEADKVKKRKAIFAHFGPVLAGGKLWVASSDGALRGFSPVNGALVAQAEIAGGAATQPAVAGGTLYVVSRKGQLLAFR